MPALSSTYFVFDGDVHTDFIASIASKGTQKENRKGKAKGKTMKGRRKGKRTKGKRAEPVQQTPEYWRWLYRTIVWRCTPKGNEAGNPKNKQEKKTQDSGCSLRLRRQVLSISRPGALLPCLPSFSCFLQQRFPYSPHPPFGFVRHASGLHGAPSYYFPPLVPPGHKSLGFFLESPVPHARFLCCMGPQYGFNSKLLWEIFHGAFGGSKTARCSPRVLSQLFGGPPGPGFVPHAICANIIRLGNRPLFCRTIAPAKKSRPFRIVVALLSHFVFFRTLTYERLVRSVRCWKPRTCRRTSRYVFRSSS